jgi:hypothetical protein
VEILGGMAGKDRGVRGDPEAALLRLADRRDSRFVGALALYALVVVLLPAIAVDAERELVARR